MNENARDFRFRVTTRRCKGREVKINAIHHYQFTINNFKRGGVNTSILNYKPRSYHNLYCQYSSPAERHPEGTKQNYPRCLQDDFQRGCLAHAAVTPLTIYNLPLTINSPSSSVNHYFSLEKEHSFAEFGFEFRTTISV